METGETGDWPVAGGECVSADLPHWTRTQQVDRSHGSPELGHDHLGAAPLPGRQLQVGHHRDIR